MKSIVLDCMGAENSPHDFVKGAIGAINEISNLKIILVGKIEEIACELEKYKYDKNRIKVINAEEIILGDDLPVNSIQMKKNSSLIIAINEMLNNNYDGMVSAGNSGAFLAACIFLIGRIKDINRPALAPILTFGNRNTILLDAGANVDCKVNNLLQFAKIGSIYYKVLFGKINPEVKLLNIGTESNKGNLIIKNTYEELTKYKEINFKGNIEARNIMSEHVDVIVCDGFIGNITLKVMEGVGKHVFTDIKHKVNRSVLFNIFKKTFSNLYKSLKSKYDYQKYGGAILLGVKKICIKAHGSANYISIRNSINTAYKLSCNNLIENLEKDM